MRSFINPWTLLLMGAMVFMSFRGDIISNPSGWLLEKIYILPGIIIGLSFHEFAHAWVAKKLGDNTPVIQGRVTINPAKHIDPIGMVALIFVGFGWGVPVQIDPRNFKNPRRDEFLVSIAGVTMNLLLAIIFTFVIKFFYMGTIGNNGEIIGIIEQILWSIVIINLVLMIFNLLPIPPLDGFNIITEIFNLKKYDWWYEVYNRGFLILLIFILFNFTGRILTPAVQFLSQLLTGLIL